jgi:dTDP-4-dehydrorhamnose 3,5-epimerase-like enzyme
MIGVRRITLEKHEDDRGFFQEILRSEQMKQVSHSFMKKGVKKTGHLHKKQTDWWYVVSGTLIVYLMKDDLKTEFTMTNNEVLKIPPGIVHGNEAITDVNLLYICSETYNKEDDLRWPK